MYAADRSVKEKCGGVVGEAKYDGELLGGDKGHGSLNLL